MAGPDASPHHDDPRGDPDARPGPGPSRLTLALAAGVVLVAGVLIGIQAQQTFGTGQSAPATAGRVRQPQGYGQQPGGQQPGMDRPRAGTEWQPGTGQRPGGAGGTTGTVEKVEGDTVYLKAMDGSTVTVTTTGTTAVQIAAPGKVSDLKAGATVVVRGERSDDGSVSAVSITQGGGGR
ncbi:hypothetical protein ACWGH8_16565 [Nonomuraea muscovyensis]